MTKIALASDLHLEMAELDLQNHDSADVLVLAGDILIAQDLHDHPEPDVPYSPEIIRLLGSRQRKAQEYRDFLKRCSLRFKHVVYVAGNHEFYHGKWVGSLNDLRDECSKYPNVYFMENDNKVIDDVLFVGASVWTDCDKANPVALYTLGNTMNDYRMIRNDELGFTKLRPAHTLSRHIKTLNYFKTVLGDNRDKKTVVVGHHAPSVMSIHQMYHDDQLVNSAYYSDLSELILDNPQIVLWTHGHVHTPFDYKIGDTRVVCNPRGYVGRERDSQDVEPYFVKTLIV